MGHSSRISASKTAVLKVVGVGGGGGNALATICQTGVRGVERIIANTDAQALQHLADLAVAQPIQLGERITRGLGAGGRPQRGYEAAIESIPQLQAELRGADLVFITAGMGGGTGTGAAPVVATVAREAGALTIGVVTKPFRFEGKRRARAAAQGLEALEPCVDSLLVIDNDRLLEQDSGNLSIRDGFRVADLVLCDAVRSISDLITDAGVINLDLADVRSVLGGSGRAVMGIGEASAAEGGAVAAAQRAMHCPLLESDSVAGAQGVLITFSSGPSLKLSDVHRASMLIEAEADDDADVVFGLVTDPALGDGVRVTLVATRFKPVARNALVLLDSAAR